MNQIEEVVRSLQDLRGQVCAVDFGIVSAQQLGRFSVAADNNGGGDDGLGAAHPLFLTSVMGWGTGPAERELRVDGTDPSATAGLQLDGLRLMGAGQDLTIHRPVTDGDDIAMSVGVEDAILKSGKTGPLIVLTLRRDYTLTDGTPLATCLETFIAR